MFGQFRFALLIVALGGYGPVQAGALHEAVEAGSTASVVKLLNAGADVNRLDERDRPPLYYAVMSGNLTMAQLLISKGANVNATIISDSVRLGMLYQAAQNNDLAMAELLLAKGATINPTDVNEHPPLIAGVHHFGMAKFLVEHGADVNEPERDGVCVRPIPLHVAASFGSLDVVKLLVEHGARINAPGEYIFTVMVAATMGDKPEIVDYLIAKGADVHGSTARGDGALAFAKSRAVAGLLVAAGIDVQARNQQGATALFRARNREVAAFLVEHGLEVNARDKRNRTPLMYAVSNDRREVVEYLLSRGADPGVKNLDGETALSLAKSPEIVALLDKAGAGKMGRQGQ